jgi:ectoine hydroxylase-related dioxygenase (phytanoyl-CoA dioxygenase family)
MTCRTAPLSPEQVSQFNKDGFLVVEEFLNQEVVARLRDRFVPLFAGEFETGVYPDEWYWREGLSLPDVTRHMANAWKSDLTVAGLALSPEIGRLTATLAGWPGARLGQDTLWWKTPGAKEIALHQDSTYTSFLEPPDMMTCWIALDDTSRDAGTIEYVRGSHRWPLVERPGDFHAPLRGYRAAMEQAAAAAGVNDKEIVYIEVPAGGCVIHHGRIWHGSGPNTQADRVRRSIGIHTLSCLTRFRADGARYIYGRYKRAYDVTMEESFFPILWTETGYRSPFLKDYCPEKNASR